MYLRSLTKNININTIMKRRISVAAAAWDYGKEEEELNRYSRQITQDKSQGASQAMLYATGMDSDDFDKAQVCVFSNWFDSNPCNMHLKNLQDLIQKNINKNKDLIAIFCTKKCFFYYYLIQ